MLKVMRNWDNVYEDYKVSGMSINAYAKKHNIPPSSAFTQMKKRLVEEGLTSENIINSSPTKNMNFIPVEVKSEYPKDICENYDKDKCKLTISIKDYKIDIYENFKVICIHSFTSFRIAISKAATNTIHCRFANIIIYHILMITIAFRQKSLFTAEMLIYIYMNALNHRYSIP